MSKPKKAFTLIELLVVIAIIGILATISVIALQNARAKSRDAKRAGDMKQVQTALELFFNDKGRYPNADEWATGQIYSTSTVGTSTYMQIIPAAPTPSDGACTTGQNTITYIPTVDGSSYSISFCLGNTTGALASGEKCLTPSGIMNRACFVCGDQVLIATIADHACNEGAPDYDKCTYDTVEIGDQCWMKQNMNIGDIINAGGNQTDNSILEKYCYNDDSANCQTDGGLYQFNEAVRYVNIVGTQGICPSGWHVGSHDDWTTLERSVCTSGSCLTDFPYDLTTTDFRGTNEGTKLRVGGGSGFEAILAGLHIANGSFLNKNVAAYFRLSNSFGGTDAWSRVIYPSISTGLYRGTNDANNATSIRCLKNL